ncbi:MAG: hypothetical protein ACYDET_07540, partial [Thermoleophilia bacterium]
SMWNVGVSTQRETLDLMLAGLGFGLVIAPISLAAINSLRRQRLASGASVLTAARIIGMAVGLAALNSWGISDFQGTMAKFPAPLPQIGQSLNDYLNQISAWESRNVQTILGVLSSFFLIAAVVSIVAIIPSLFLTNGNRSEPDSD